MMRGRGRSNKAAPPASRQAPALAERGWVDQTPRDKSSAALDTGSLVEGVTTARRYGHSLLDSGQANEIRRPRGSSARQPINTSSAVRPQETLPPIQEGGKLLPGFSSESLPLQRWSAVIQCKDFTEKFKDSVFQSTKKKREAIYMLYDTATKDELVQYVGKSNDSVKRFKQHQAGKKGSATWKSQELAGGDWTPFETATHEQYWIGEARGKKTLVNKINALAQDKWEWFCTPTGQPHNKDQETQLTKKHWT